MKIFRSLVILAVSAALLFACAPAADTVPAAPTSSAGEYLSIEYSDAASLRSQLAFGIMKLDGTTNAVTPEQAKTLIPLWQAVIALSGDSTTASEELTAVQDQIVAALTPEQLQSIAALQITNADLSLFYAEYRYRSPHPRPGRDQGPRLWKRQDRGGKSRGSSHCGSLRSNHRHRAVRQNAPVREDDRIPAWKSRDRSEGGEIEIETIIKPPWFCNPEALLVFLKTTWVRCEETASLRCFVTVGLRPPSTDEACPVSTSFSCACRIPSRRG